MAIGPPMFMIVTIDRSSFEPPYLQLARILRQAIVRGEYAPGEKLPSEARLSEMYELGRDAVRDALQELRSEGAIVTVQGTGSFVRGGGDLEEVRLPVGAKVTGRMPTADERRELGADAGVPVFVVTVGDDSHIYLADRTTLVASGE